MQRNPYWPLNGPSFFSTTEIPFTVYFTHCPGRAVGFGLKFSRRGWQADVTSRMCQTRSRSPAAASFELECHCDTIGPLCTLAGRREAAWRLFSKTSDTDCGC
jgi:hypothetical protein